jgi:hypothetical protein
MCIAACLNNSTSWEEWTAVGTLILAALTLALAIAAFLAIYSQKSQFRKQRIDDNERAFKNNSVILIANFEKQFDELENYRIEVAKAIIDNKLLEKDSFDYGIIDKRMDKIYDLFDTLGYFVDQEYIKADVAHQFFDYWFSKYYEFYKLYNIRELAGYEKTVWNNLPKLSTKLDEIEAKQLGKEKEKITRLDLKEFFLEEARDDI